MTAREMIGYMAHKVGLCMAGDEPEQIMVYGLKALNRGYQWLWNQYPFRDNKLFDYSVIPTGRDIVLPVEMDTVRSVVLAETRADVPCIDPIDAERMRESNGAVVGYVNLPDSALARSVDEAIGAVYAALARVGGVAVGNPVVRAQVEGSDAAGIKVYKNHRFFDVPQEMTVADAGKLFNGCQRLVLDAAGVTGSVWVEVAAEDERVFEAEIASFSGQYSGYRTIRLVGGVKPVRIHGTRRFFPLLTLDDSILLPRLENALLCHLAAELYEFAGVGEKAVTERAKATDELKAAIEFQEGVDTEELSETPEISFFQVW